MLDDKKVEVHLRAYPGFQHFCDEGLLVFSAFLLMECTNYSFYLRRVVTD